MFVLQGVGIDEIVFVEIMIFRINEELDEIKVIYEKGKKKEYFICLCFCKLK